MILFLKIVFRGRVSLQSLGYPRTHSVDQCGLELTKIWLVQGSTQDMDAGDTSYGPHTCTASTFSTEPPVLPPADLPDFF